MRRDGSEPPGAPRDDVTGALERLAVALPGGGERRHGQMEMARRVGQAIEQRRHLVVQAGTGTGKSLAYLLPAVRSGQRVVVATATKALQEQLATKDLPFLAATLWPERELTYAVLKGRANYLCRQRAAEVSRAEEDTLLRPQNEGEPFEEPREGSTAVAGTGVGEGSGISERSVVAGPSGVADQIRRILSWAEHSVTGDRADLGFEPHPRAWSALSVGAHECPGAFRCPSGAVCFAEKARALAAASDVVVVNTHLYATHVASGGAVLPDHELLVLDEAHAVEDVMTESLGVEMTAGRLRAVASTSRPLLGRGDTGLVDDLQQMAERLDRSLQPLAGRRVLRDGADAATGAEADLTRVLALARARLEALASALRRADDEDGGRRTRAVLAATRALEELAALETASEDHVAWVEANSPGGRAPALRLAPIDVGPTLAANLWPKVTAVLTSATVPALLETRLGLPEETDHVDVGSPFPYSECAVLYCPVDLPDRRSRGAPIAVHDELSRIITAAGGRTLALFTSWRAMRDAVESLRPRLAFTLLAQNDLPKPKLVEAFRDEESVCLFATMSFWQGVDVPGSTLSVVAIDRLPFPRPDDPLLQARRERAGDGAFGTVDLPRAATLLAQGAGRLIRSTHDAGMVAVLDRRLATAGYGRTLREALPPMRFTTERADAMAFLASLALAAPGHATPRPAAPRPAGSGRPDDLAGPAGRTGQ